MAEETNTLKNCIYFIEIFTERIELDTRKEMTRVKMPVINILGINKKDMLFFLLT